MNKRCPCCNGNLIAYPRGDYLCEACGRSFHELELSQIEYPDRFELPEDV